MCTPPPPKKLVLGSICMRMLVYLLLAVALQLALMRRVHHGIVFVLCNAHKHDLHEMSMLC